MSPLFNIKKKSWYAEAISLDDHIAALVKIRDGLNGRPAKVVGVCLPINPREALLVGIQQRSELLDHQVGMHLNRLGADAHEHEVNDSSEDAIHQAEQGEVVYIVLGQPTDAAAPECYEL